jgi:hypothetical protein
MEKEQKVKFNNKEYEWNKLSHKAKHIFGQLRDLDNKILQSRMLMDQLNMARQGFTTALQAELEGKPTPQVKVNYVPKKPKDSPVN